MRVFTRWSWLALVLPLLGAACGHDTTAPAPDLATVGLARPFADYFADAKRESVLRALHDTTTRCGQLTLWAPDSSVVTRWHVALDTAAFPANVLVPDSPRFGARGGAWSVAI